DAVVDRVLEQRLQHQRRQQRVGGRRIELPGDAQPLAEAQLLDLGVALEQPYLVGKAHEALRIRDEAAKQVRQVLERPLGALRVAANERQHRVDAVEEKVRPDARLQRLQPRLGERRRERLDQQPEIDEQERGKRGGEERAAQRRRLRVQQ